MGNDANVVLGWFLNKLSEKVDISIIELQGGLKDNAIPVEAYAVVAKGTESDGKLNPPFFPISVPE